MPVHLLTTAAISSLSTSSLSSAPLACSWRTRSLAAWQVALQLAHLAVAQLGGLLQVVVALGRLDLDAHLVDLLFQRLHLGDGIALGLPARGQLGALLLEVGQRLLQFGQPVLAGLVLLLLERLALDLQLHHLAVDLVQRLRLGVDLHAQPAGRLVDQVDRLVGQEAVGDVAMAQRGRRDHGAVGDAHAVVHLVALLQAAQDADGVLDRAARPP